MPFPRVMTMMTFRSLIPSPSGGRAQQPLSPLLLLLLPRPVHLPKKTSRTLRSPHSGEKQSLVDSDNLLSLSVAYAKDGRVELIARSSRQKRIYITTFKKGRDSNIEGKVQAHASNQDYFQVVVEMVSIGGLWETEKFDDNSTID